MLLSKLLSSLVKVDCYLYPNLIHRWYQQPPSTFDSPCFSYCRPKAKIVDSDNSDGLSSQDSLLPQLNQRLNFELICITNLTKNFQKCSTCTKNVALVQNGIDDDYFCLSSITVSYIMIVTYLMTFFIRV